MIDNSADKENALRLGESFRIAREKHNVTLIQAAEKLKIRSFLLNDMEKGRFGHLRTRDCLVYAKFLGLKISQEDIENIRKSQGGEAQNDTESGNKKVVAVGAAAVVGAFLVIAVIISCLSGKNREQNDSGMLQLPQNESGETSTLVLPQQSAGSDSISVTLPLNDAEVQTVQPVTVNEPKETADKQSSAAVEQPDVSETTPESGVVIGSDSSEPTFRSMPDVDPEDVKPEAPVKRDTGRNTVIEDRRVPQTNSMSRRDVSDNIPVNTQQTTIQRTDSRKTPAVQPARKAETPVAAKKTHDNSAAAAVSRNTATTSKSSGLKAGQVVSLADEMGVKKAPAVKQAPVARQSVPAVKQEAKKTAVKDAGKAGASAGMVAKPLNGSKGLKAGQVVSLADEMGYKKQPAKKTVAPAQQPPAKTSGKKNSAIGPKITDPNEIKRRASQVVITEAVQ